MIAWLLLDCLAIGGHLAVWISFWNKTQGRCLPKWLMRTFSATAKLACVSLPPIVAYFLRAPSTSGSSIRVCTWVYFASCVAVASVGIPWTWLQRIKRRKALQHVIAQHSRVVVENRACTTCDGTASGITKFLLGLPCNEVFEVEVNEKHFHIPRLPAILDGLAIAHLSDLHFTGQIAKPFFESAIDRINAMDVDLVAITGDIIDNANCLPWIPDTLGRLRAKHGIYVILGNHDCKTSPFATRNALQDAGLVVINGQLHRELIRGELVYLASNELPWSTPATDMSRCDSRDSTRQLRILLAHSPDRLPWARRFDFDLMLAGHTHGGQVCIPGFGPFVCPCRLPLEFATGTIYDPPTLMHVSRGLSAEVPLRFNCRPEITRVVLRSLVADGHAHADVAHDIQSSLIAEPVEACAGLA